MTSPSQVPHRGGGGQDARVAFPTGCGLAGLELGYRTEQRVPLGPSFFLKRFPLRFHALEWTDARFILRRNSRQKMSDRFKARGWSGGWFEELDAVGIKAFGFGFETIQSLNASMPKNRIPSALFLSHLMNAVI